MRTKGIILVALVGVLIVAGGFIFRSPRITQPLKFNHKKHMEAKVEEGKEKITCRTCHKYYEERRVAGRPSLRICTSCHSGGEAKTEEEKRLREYADRKLEIPWRRLYRVPDTVNFSHQRHVVFGKVECRECHGDFARLPAPPPEAIVPVSMDACIECHKLKKVTVDCNACHH